MAELVKVLGLTLGGKRFISLPRSMNNVCDKYDKGEEKFEICFRSWYYFQEEEREIVMKKKELLVPVGNMESLYQAIHNGADAVYLGGKNFGARKFAVNFDREEMIKAIRTCHLYDVKVYVTVNTLIYDEEVTSFLDYVEFLYRHDVDALIMQDFGMIGLVREKFPELEIHASTQMHNHNKQGLEFLKSLGVKRAVLARELSLQEIDQLDVPIEKEVFIHGALCICYSGCCLFSSMIGGRSGNRGECAGSCRLPYTLLEDDQEIKTEGKYLLSPKELCTASRFGELMASDIDSFKIEGRMKSPEYVGFITKFYRELMEQYEKTHQVLISDDRRKELASLFTRGFTHGHLFGDRGEQLMNIKTPNHIGYPLGKVIEVTPEKITILLDDTLTQEDGIRFMESGKGCIVNYLYNQKGMLIHDAKSQEIVEIDNKFGLTKKDTVYKTLDGKLMKQLRTYSEKKIPVTMQVIAKENEPFTLILEDKKQHKVIVQSSIIEKAKTSCMSQEKLEKQLNKLGNTPFCLTDIKVEMDENIFLSISELNETRRKAVEELILKRSNPKKDHLVLENKVNPLEEVNNPEKQIAVSVQTEAQLIHCLSLPFDRIDVRDITLYQKYQEDSRIYYLMPRVRKSKQNYPTSRMIITELSGLREQTTNQFVSDYPMNVTNAYTAYYLKKHGISIITLSVELKDYMLKRFTEKSKQLGCCSSLEKIVYGRVDLMIMKHCLLNHLVNDTKRPCHVCRNGKTYHLKDRKGMTYPIFTEGELVHILSHRLDSIEKIGDYYKEGIRRFRLILFDETNEEITALYKRCHK